MSTMFTNAASVFDAAESSTDVELGRKVIRWALGAISWSLQLLSLWYCGWFIGILLSIIIAVCCMAAYMTSHIAISDAQCEALGRKIGSGINRVRGLFNRTAKVSA